MNTPKDSTAERTPGSLHPAGSAATPYQVRCRQSDNRYCIYLRDYAVVIGELNTNITNADLVAIKEIFDGKMPPND